MLRKMAHVGPEALDTGTEKAKLQQAGSRGLRRFGLRSAAVHGFAMKSCLPTSISLISPLKLDIAVQQRIKHDAVQLTVTG